MDAFTSAVAEYDSLSRLDGFKTELLVRVHMPFMCHLDFYNTLSTVYEWKWRSC